MKKIIITGILLLPTLLCLSQKDTLFFIGELRWKIRDTTKKIQNGELGERIPFETYSEKKRYKLNNLHTEHTNPTTFFSVHEYKKETYYNDSEMNVVEVRIGIPAKVFNSKQSSVQVSGDIDVKNIKNKRHINEFTIVKPARYSEDSTDFIDSNTFKLDKPILISFPEDVSVDVITTYIQDRLYNVPDSIGGFSSFIKKYNFLNNEPIEGPFDYGELMNFYKLLHFIEPYVSSDAFLNLEANKLNQQLISENQRLQNSDYISKISTDSLLILKEDYLNSLNIYNNYLSFSKALTTYYKQLRNIIFSETPVQKGMQNRSSQIRLGVGSGIFYGSPQVYNVTISGVDTTVQFEKLSKINAVVSTGLLFSLNSHKKDSTVDGKNLNNKNSFYAGVNVNYYLNQSFQNTRFSFPIGMSVGVGKQYGNFLLMSSVGIRKVRTPLTFFKSNFQNKKLLLNGPDNPATTFIDPQNNSLFIDRFGFNAGISVLYIFKNK